MEPFLFFVMIAVAIWVLSAIASAINNQQAAQRRRQVRQQLGQQPAGQQPIRGATGHPFGQAPVPPPPPSMQQQQQQPWLNQGYAVRHPEMMAPPQQPQRGRAVARPSAMRPPPGRQQPQPRGQRRAVRQAPIPMPAPPIPMFQSDDAPRARPMAQPPPLMQGARPVQPARAAAATAAAAKQQAVAPVTAPAISRWLQPATLRQQFILTEIFQPPLAMREERNL